MNTPTKTFQPVRLAVTIPEASEATGLSRSSLYLLMGAGKIPSLKVGKRRLIAWADLEAFIQASRQSEGAK